MINFLRNTVRIAFALPIALSFAIGAAQADKIKIALAETPVSYTHLRAHET